MAKPIAMSRVLRTLLRRTVLLVMQNSCAFAFRNFDNAVSPLHRIGIARGEAQINEGKRVSLGSSNCAIRHETSDIASRVIIDRLAGKCKTITGNPKMPQLASRW